MVIKLWVALKCDELRNQLNIYELLKDSVPWSYCIKTSIHTGQENTIT
jgi:hypothetical protein